MITPSSAFTTANAKLQKQPTFILEIEGYNRAFTNRPGLGQFGGLPVNPVLQFADRIYDFGGLSFVPVDTTLSNPVTPGNLVFAFLWFGVIAPGISDTLGNTWTQIFADAPSNMTVWYTIAGPSGVGTIRWDPSDIYNHHFSEFFVVEVPASYAGFTYGSNSGTTPSGVPGNATCTVGSNTVSIPIGAVLGGDNWSIFMIALAQQTSVSMGINLQFFATGPIGPGAYPDTIIGAAGSEVMCSSQSTAYDWIKSIDDLKITISDMDGASDLSNLVFNVQDFNQHLTADMASFVFEGKKFRMLSGFVGMTVDQFLTLYTGSIDTVESDNGNIEYKFTVSSRNLKKLAELIYAQSDADANGNTFAVDGKHPRTVLGHPLDILVSALQQAGIALSDIDTAKIYYYRDTIFNGLSYEFTLTSAPAAKDFIENELMKPMGMYLWENNLGLLSVNSFYPAISGNGSYTPPTPPVRALDSSKIVTVPVELQASLIDQVTFRFDDDGNQFNAETVQSWDVAITKYGLFGGKIIESKGMRSGFQGYFMAAIISRLIFLRYGGKPIILDPLPLFWSECVLEPGDIISVTLAFIPDRKAGVLGVTTKAFEVMDRNWRFMAGVTELKLLEIDLAAFKQSLITPNAEADYAADTAPNQAKYMYLCDSTGKYSTGAAANTLG